MIAQNVQEVEVKGVGIDREQAVQDGLRAAVGKAFGTYVSSETEVENFVTIRDAISTRSEAYVKSYEVIDDIPFPDRHEVTLKALVSLDPIERDAAQLEEILGGLTFIVVYDDRTLDETSGPNYDFAYDRMNEKLAENKLNRTESHLFKRLAELMDPNEGGMAFLTKLGYYTDSEFVIFIKSMNIKIEAKAAGLTSAQVTMDVIAYDNCNARNLGSSVFTGDVMVHQDQTFAVRDAISSAINNGFDRLLYLFNSDMGKWIDNGAPYELRFYAPEEVQYKYADMMQLRMKLEANPQFGGEVTMTRVGNYFKFVLNSKAKQSSFIDNVFNSIYEIPTLAALELEPQIIYHRQITFGPFGHKIPEAEEKTNIMLKANR